MILPKIRMEDGYVIEGIKNIPLELNNPIFDDELIRGTFSYSIEIEGTPGNCHAFGYVQLPEVVVSVDNLRYANIYLSVSGLNLKGDLVILEASPTGFKGTLLFGWSKEMTALKTETLHDLEMPDLELVTNVYINTPGTIADIDDIFNYYGFMSSQFGPKILAVNEAEPGTLPICFPHFQDKEYHFNSLAVRRIDGDIQVYNPFPTSPIAFKPWYNVYWLLNAISEKYNLAFEGSILDDPYFKRVILPPIKKMSYRESERLVLPPPDPARGFILFGYPPVWNTKGCLPKFQVLDFIKRIRNHFFIATYINLVENKLVMDTWESVLESREYVDWTDKVEEYLDIKLKVTEGYNFNYETGTDVWAERSIKSLEDKTILDPVVLFADLAGLGTPEMDTLVFVEQMGMYYEPNFDDNGQLTGWKPYSHIAFGKRLGKEEFERAMILPSLEDFQIPGYDFATSANNGVIWNLFDYISNYGFQKPIVESKIQDGQLRVSWWMGRRHANSSEESTAFYMASSIGEPMPATADFYLQFPKPDYSLWADRKEGRPYWDKQGVFEKYGQKFWELIRNSKKQRFRIRLTESDLFSLPATRKIRIGNNLYLYDTIRVELPIKEAAEVEMYWLPPGI